jgi:hypothetical protein
MKTTIMLWCGKHLDKILWVIAILLVAIAMLNPVRASAECLTRSEAHHAYPNKHLWWHPGEDGRCWDNTHGKRHASRHRIRPTPPAELEGNASPRSVKGLASSGMRQERDNREIRSPQDSAETIWPRVIHITMVGTNFNDRWPDELPTISPLRWSHELMEFGR